MSAIAVTPAYTALLVRIPPHVIENDEQNEAYIEALYELDQDPNPTREASDYAALLTMLIEQYEEEHYALPRASQQAMLEFLLDQHNMDATALAATQGLESIREVLDGTRELTAGEIRALSARFHLSPELFF